MVQMALPWAIYRVPDDLPDDTEDSIVGTEWHQEAIHDLAGRLDEAGRRQQATWGVCSQVALNGLRHAGGQPYDPRPDVFVLPRPLPAGWLSAIGLDDAGPPFLIVEVASKSTVHTDIGDKRLAYEAIGVQEYLVFDPDGPLLPTPLLAWRLQDAGYVPWEAAADGWWHSETLGVSFRPDQPLLAVRDHLGMLIPSFRDSYRLLEQERALRAEEQARRLALEEELRRLRDPGH
jgi:Uma2 family endonuclease